MILRIAHGRLPDLTDAAALVALRERLQRAARSVDGFESLILGARRAPDGRRTEGVITTVWRDAESMTRVISASEDGRFIGRRLELPFEVERVDHYEIVGRTFAALPPATPALVRLLTVTAGQHEEARLVEILRAQQPRLVERGLIASHLGRRVVQHGSVEAVHVTVWPDPATLRAAADGRPEAPIFLYELRDWLDATRIEMFDGIEVAPRLPALSGPPLLVVDERLRIVDITASAAAMLGLPAEEMVGKSVDELTTGDPSFGEAAWAGLLETGTASGAAAWAVPEIGAVVLHFVARRDSPIHGRHAILVRRRSEPPPTLADLDAVVAAAFPIG